MVNNFQHFYSFGVQVIANRTKFSPTFMLQCRDNRNSNKVLEVKHTGITDSLSHPTHIFPHHFLSWVYVYSTFFTPHFYQSFSLLSSVYTIFLTHLFPIIFSLSWILCIPPFSLTFFLLAFPLEFCVLHVFGHGSLFSSSLDLFLYEASCSLLIIHVHFLLGFCLFLFLYCLWVPVNVLYKPALLCVIYHTLSWNQTIIYLKKKVFLALL